MSFLGAAKCDCITSICFGLRRLSAVVPPTGIDLRRSHGGAGRRSIREHFHAANVMNDLLLCRCLHTIALHGVQILRCYRAERLFE